MYNWHWFGGNAMLPWTVDLVTGLVTLYACIMVNTCGSIIRFLDYSLKRDW